MPKATLLIVDDIPENIAVLGGILSSDFRILVANSGLRALELANSADQPDLILLDVMMPEMDGYQVLTRLRENCQTFNIPVIFVTAMDSTDNEQRGFDLGAVDYISKPICPSVVLARVKTHLELKIARDCLKHQNILLEAEIAKRLAENQLAQQISINALARLAEIRNPETGNHILRTQAYVNILAKQLQHHPRFQTVMTPHYIQQLTQSAPLHDIGKVGIPDHILQKPGKLTADEWKIMKTHSQLGFDAINRAEQDCTNSITFLTIAKQIALSHHEKWDGSGYPQGLSGEDIPIPARLMALADVFDAMVSQRIYKPALPFSEARGYIISQSGKHFDPRLVDAFASTFPDFLTIAQSLSGNKPKVKDWLLSSLPSQPQDLTGKMAANLFSPPSKSI